jgi:hypothetical protein
MCLDSSESMHEQLASIVAMSLWLGSALDLSELRRPVKRYDAGVMGNGLGSSADPAILRRHALCFRLNQSSIAMSQKVHFWLRIVGLVVILALEFGPRIVSSSAVPSRARLAAATTSVP